MLTTFAAPALVGVALLKGSSAIADLPVESWNLPVFHRWVAWVAGAALMFLALLLELGLVVTVLGPPA